VGRGLDCVHELLLLDPHSVQDGSVQNSSDRKIEITLVTSEGRLQWVVEQGCKWRVVLADEEISTGWRYLFKSSSRLGVSPFLKFLSASNCEGMVLSN
jgi:hypothetical protein